MHGNGHGRLLSEHFCGVWASSRTIPRWESLFYFVLLSFCFARESGMSRYMCGDERVLNGCVSMYAEGEFGWPG
jgi:hypothetical protein